MNNSDLTLGQSLNDVTQSTWDAIAAATPVKARKPRQVKAKAVKPKAEPKKRGPKPGSRSWEKGIAAAVAKNKTSRNEAQRASLAKANARFKELANERVAAYHANPKRCLHCTMPLDYKRVTKEGALFCDRHCSATFNNLNPSDVGRRKHASATPVTSITLPADATDGKNTGGSDLYRPMGPFQPTVQAIIDLYMAGIGRTDIARMMQTGIEIVAQAVAGIPLSIRGRFKPLYAYYGDAGEDARDGIAFAISGAAADKLFCGGNRPSRWWRDEFGAEHYSEYDGYWDIRGFSTAAIIFAMGQRTSCPVCASGLYIPSYHSRGDVSVGTVGSAVTLSPTRVPAAAVFVPGQIHATTPAVWGVDAVVCEPCWSAYSENITELQTKKALALSKAVDKTVPIKPPTALEAFCAAKGISPVNLHFLHNSAGGTPIQSKFKKEYMRVLRVDEQRVYWKRPKAHTSWNTPISSLEKAVDGGLYFNGTNPPQIKTELELFCDSKGLMPTNLEVFDGGVVRTAVGIKKGQVYFSNPQKTGSYLVMPIAKFEELMDRGRVTSVRAPVTLWSKSTAAYPLASDPLMASIGMAIHQFVLTQPDSGSRYERFYGSLSKFQVWMQLAQIAKRCRLTEWSKALQANVRTFKTSDGYQKSLAGYLIYLMTAQRSHPIGAPFLNRVWSGHLEMETEELMDDWHFADEAAKPYFRAAKKAGIGRWWA